MYTGIIGIICALVYLSYPKKYSFHFLLSALAISPLGYVAIDRLEMERAEKSSVLLRVGIQMLISLILFIMAVIGAAYYGDATTEIEPTPIVAEVTEIETEAVIIETETEEMIFSGVETTSPEPSESPTSSDPTTEPETIPETTEPPTEAVTELETENEEAITETMIEIETKQNTIPDSDVIKAISKGDFSIYSIYSKPNNPNVSVSSISLDSALEKASNHFPYNEVEMYYSFKTSYCFKSETRGNVYFVIYSLNENGKLYNEEHPKARISIEIYTVIKTASNGDVEEAYFKGEPERWMLYPEKNDYTKSDWYYNFMDYYVETQ